MSERAPRAFGVENKSKRGEVNCGHSNHKRLRFKGSTYSRVKPSQTEPPLFQSPSTMGNDKVIASSAKIFHIQS